MLLPDPLPRGVLTPAGGILGVTEPKRNAVRAVAGPGPLTVICAWRGPRASDRASIVRKPALMHERVVRSLGGHGRYRTADLCRVKAALSH